MRIPKVYFRNLGASWGGRAAHICVAFLLMPFMIHTLGNVRYGIWSLIISICGYMGLADVGLRRSISKHLNQYLAQTDNMRAMQVVSTALALLMLAAPVITVSAHVVGLWFHRVFPDVSGTDVSEIRVILLMIGAQLSISLVGSLFRRIAEAFDRFDLVNAIGIVRLIVQTIGIIGVLIL